MKSCQWEDVDETNIKLFFRKALPVPPPEAAAAAAAAAAEERFQTINMESKRWHTDKIMSHFGREFAEGPFRPVLNTVAQVVVELRREANQNRRG